MFNGQLGGFSLPPFVICFFGCPSTLGALDMHYEGELFFSLSMGVVIQSQQAEGDRTKLTHCYGLTISFKILRAWN